jgi:hypothetical protein
MALLKRATDPYERLLDGRTIDANGCWISHLTPASAGYVYISQRRGVPKLEAHRLSYERNIGPIPEGLDLDHTCRNRACWNYEHVEPVTRQVNLLRGETRTAINAAKIDCSRGHKLPPYVAGQKRQCRPCQNQMRRLSRARKRAA